MLLAGDECRRSQGGNNNPYLQDNEVSWFDWSLVTPTRGPGRSRSFSDRFSEAPPRVKAQRVLSW